MLRWVVRPGDGATVGQVLRRAGADAAALGDGRVFVGSADPRATGRVVRRRAQSEGEPLAEGDELTVAPPQRGTPQPLCVILREGDLLAVDKPAGIPTIPDHGGSAHSLLALVAAEVSMPLARVHATSRLDREVSGVVFFALSPAAGERLRQARAEGRYARRYVALAARAPAPPRGEWDAPIGRARDPRLRAVGGRDPAPALTRYAAVAVAPAGQALLVVAPATGRTHQIRVHAAHAGAPLLGDRAYGGPTRVTLAGGRVVEPGRIALHAQRVTVPGERGEAIVACAQVPEGLVRLWGELGGEEGGWEGEVG